MSSPIVDDGVLTQAELDFLVDAAIERWAATGLTAEQISYLQSVTFQVADMPGMYLGSVTPGVVTIDSDAAGLGWFLDATPLDDSEFANAVSSTQLYADPAAAPAGDIDLLTTIMHELGHQLGLTDDYDLAQSDDLMYGYLTMGERRLPTAGQADGYLTGSIAHEEFLVGPISLGTLPANKAVQVIFQATVNNLTNGLAPTLSAQGTVSGSNFTTLLTDDPAVGGTTDPTTTTLDSLTIGNQVFIDMDGGGTFNAGDTGVNGVALSLFVDADNNNVPDGAAIATTTTAGGGLYSFAGLLPGNYIVRVDAGNFASGGPLVGLVSVTGATDPDNNTDHDDNGVDDAAATTNGIRSQSITLAYNTEPTNGTGNDTNLTLDFGFLDNEPPVATDDEFTTGEDGPDVTGNLITGDNGSGADSDAENDALTITHVNGLAANVGTQITLASGALLTVNAGGSFTYDPNGAFEHLDDAETAPETFTYTLSDAPGGTDTATVTITINGLDDPPLATDNAATTDEDTSVGGNVITDDDGDGVDSDVEGDNLSVTSITVDGDVLAVGVTHTLDSGATLIVNSDGSYTYNPNGAFEHLGATESDTETFTYTLSDGDAPNATATVTITIDGVNDDPVATDDEFTVGESDTLSGNLITDDNGNGPDTDAEDDALAITEVNGSAANVGTQITLSSGALLTVNSDGSFDYDTNGAFEDLDDGETDTDTFSYEVSDGEGGFDTATVTITINGTDDPPVATDNSATTDEDTSVSGNVISDDDGDGADSDPEGDTLSILAVNGSAADVGTEITLPSGARLTVNSDGSYTYDPSGAFDHLGAGEPGEDTFTYTLSDGDAPHDTAEVTVSITGVNDDPLATDDAFNVGEFETVSGNLITGNNGNGPDTDAEGDTLTVVEVNGVSANVGTPVTLASGALVTVNADGTFTYDPNGAFDVPEGATDTDGFSYTISDGMATSTADVEITIDGLGPRGDIVARFKPSGEVVTLSVPGTLPVDVDIVFTADGVELIGRNGTTINGLAALSIDGIDTVKGALGVAEDTAHVTGEADLFTLDLRGGENGITFEDFTSARVTTVNSRLGGLEFEATDSEFFKLVVNTGDFDDSFTLQNVTVLNTTILKLFDGLHDVTIDDSTFLGNVSLQSTGDHATLAIDASPANLEETHFHGTFKYITGSDATIEVSPTGGSDATTFHKAASFLAQPFHSQISDDNAIYLGARKLKNVTDV